MKTLIILALLSLISAGCSSIKTIPSNHGAPHSIKEKKAVVVIEHATFFDLVSHDKIQLQFQELDRGRSLSVIIEKGISQKMIPPGHWELTGYELNGTSYLSMNTSKKFILTVTAKSSIYSGSIVIGCPSIGPDDFKVLKNMKFFNRYPFSSSKGLCELVVGNDLVGIKSSLQKSQKFKKLNLKMGF